MTNAYCDLALLKSGGALNITGSAHDGRLLALLEEASRRIDGHCNRYFYVLHATRRFEANWWTAGMQQLLVPDLIAANSVRHRRGRPACLPCPDGPPREPRWRTASYRLYPLDAAPDQPWGRPHTRMAIDVGADLGVCPGAALPDCHALVEISGRWGYRQVVNDTGATLAAELGEADTTFAVSDGVPFSPGQTLSVDDEQVHVTAVSETEITVARAVNGTAAAAHMTGAAIGIYRYPAPVVEACLQLAMQLWRGPEQPPSGRAGLGREVETLLSPYRKLPV